MVIKSRILIVLLKRMVYKCTIDFMLNRTLSAFLMVVFSLIFLSWNEKYKYNMNNNNNDGDDNNNNNNNMGNILTLSNINYKWSHYGKLWYSNTQTILFTTSN